LAKFLFASRQLNPLMLVEYRMLLSIVILGALMAWRARDEMRIRPADWRFFLLYGSVGMAMVQLSYFTAIREGSVATAIFLQYLAPGLTAAYSVLWLRLPPPAGLGVNLALALAGSGLLLLGGASRGLATTPLGMLAGISSAGFLSFYAIYGARAVAKYSPRTVLLYALGVGALCLMPLARPWQVLGIGGAAGAAAGSLAGGAAAGAIWVAADWWFALYMAVFGTLVPFSLFLEGLRTVEPVQAVLVSMLEPVLATLGAWLFLAERLSLLQLGGGALILAAIGRLQLGRRPNPERQAD
jgi:drug/metabolite transporter (DMT)-like permease